jgi:hypothetical protein
MQNSSSIYPKYRPSGNTMIDSDEVLEEYIGSGEQDNPEGKPRVTEERTKLNTSNVQRHPPTASTRTLDHTSRMKPSGKSKRGFLPIAMPRPDPPDEADAMSRSSSYLSFPPHIEVRSFSEHADDNATEVSDMTYTTEFVSEGLAYGEKGATKSPLQRYHAILQEKRHRRASIRERLQLVAEERESNDSSSERKSEHIDVTSLEKVDPPDTPIDVTALEDFYETIDLVGKEPPVVIDATSFGEPIYQPSSVISGAKRHHALREAKAKVLMKRSTRQEPPSSDVAAPSSTIGPPTPRAKNLAADNPQTETPVPAKSPPTPKTQSTSQPNPESAATSNNPSSKESVPSLLKKSLKSSSPSRAGPRRAAAEIVSKPKPATFSEVSKGMQSDNNAIFMLEETLSAEGSIVIDTTNIDEDDIYVMQMLNSNAKEGETKAVFSFVSNGSAKRGVAPKVIAPKVVVSEEITPAAMEPEGITSEDVDGAIASKTAATETTAQESRQPEEEESHFKEFVMFTAGCIQSFATSVNSTVQEKIKEMPPIPVMDLLSDNDMDGMLGALEKGMSERNFIVPTEDEEREMLSNFLEEHITQPVCGMDRSTSKSGITQNEVDELIGSVAKSYKMGFVNCGVSEPKTQKNSKRMNEAAPTEFVVPVNYSRRRRQTKVKE